MPANSQKDLFDDSTMSFGEHLEELRIRLWRGLIGLAIGVVLMLFIGDKLIALVRVPIDNALQQFNIETPEQEGETRLEDRNWRDYLREVFGWGNEPAENENQAEDESPSNAGETQNEIDESVRVKVRAHELAGKLHEIYPEHYAAPPEEETEKKMTITLWAPEFAQFKKSRQMALQPITLTVQEAFLTYLKVSVVAGLILSAPWLFYQIWMFVAAGLYPHEKKYVYYFLPISTLLFLIGASFCFFVVFQFVLKFLLGFNAWLDTTPQIRLSEWISFAIMLPVMFGVSFQLPLVMLFLERIQVFEVQAYREQRRMAVLVIAILSMLLTPSDPMSMMLMMLPMCLLYELGIFMCRMMEKKKPFEPETV